MNTKQQIIQAATALFNQHGTAKVSTNHIAEKAGISPGNLYYHFENKAHIIREIYEDMIRSWETPYMRVDQRTLSIATLERFIEENFELLWGYRFFYREIVALLHDDRQLAERHASITEQRLARQRTILQQLADEGLLQVSQSGMGLEDILMVTWLIANNYLVHLESINRSVTYHDFEEGAALVVKVLQPYLND